jgi:hypothetical protein
MTTIVLTPRPVNQSVSFLIQNPSGTPSTSAPADLTLLRDGSVVPVAEAAYFTDIALHGLARVYFTPIATGLYTLFAYGEIQGMVDVVSRTTESYLRNLEDEALGSWAWNKSTGYMEMIRQDGTTLAKYAVTDSLTESSRERTL